MDARGPITHRGIFIPEPKGRERLIIFVLRGVCVTVTVGGMGGWRMEDAGWRDGDGVVRQFEMGWDEMR